MNDNLIALQNIQSLFSFEVVNGREVAFYIVVFRKRAQRIIKIRYVLQKKKEVSWFVSGMVE